MKRCTSASCGLLWLDPPPSDAELATAYARYYTHEPPEDVIDSPLHRAYGWLKEGYYGRRYGYTVSPPAIVKSALGWLIEALPVARDNLDMRIMELPAVPSGRLLDVGCGSGGLLLVMRRLGWRVEGVDTDPRAVDVARSLGLDARQGNLEDQGYSDGSFDAIMMSHVIEHVRDPLQLVCTCRRLLHPGGRLGIVTPNARSQGHRRYGEIWRGLEPPRHLRVFTAGALHQLVQSAGLTVQRFRTSPRLAAMIRRESLQPPAAGHVHRGWTFRDHAETAFAYARWMIDRSGGEELLMVAAR
jgi:2-polyprenyl-3-methyl-5-hydroxy-6-metoxy-1,4-benzoquinol methylase